MKKKLLSLILSAALLCNVGILPAFAEEGTSAAPTVGASQESCPECGGENGAHQKDCPQYTPPEPEPQERTVTGWQWVDEEEILTDGMLALPGASEENPALFEDIASLLPSFILAETEGGQEKEEIALAGWDCPDYPKEGAYEGRHLFTARLPEGYLLSGEAPALEIAVELGGAALLEESEGILFDENGSQVYANGIPIVIKANNGITSIYDESGNLLSGETDISRMFVFGGWKGGSHTGNTSVTVESGYTTYILGGNCGGSLFGDTHVSITGGTVEGYVFGGGFSDTLTGNTKVSLTGGSIGWAYGGGWNAQVIGTAEVTAGSGAQIWGQKITNSSSEYKGTVFGGGLSGSVKSTRLILQAADYGWAYGGGENCNIDGSTHVFLEEKPAAFAWIYAGGNGGSIAKTMLEVNGSIGETSQTPSIYGGGYGDTVGHAQIILRGDCNLSGGILCAGGEASSGSTVEEAEILIEDWKLTGTDGTVCGTLDGSGVSGKTTVKVNGQQAPLERLQLYLQGMDEVLLQDTSVVLFASNEPDSDGKLSLERLDIALSAQVVFTANNMTVEIGSLSGSGTVIFESMNALSQPSSISVGEIAAGTQLTLKPSGAGWDASRIENMVFFRGAGIDALASADCFSSEAYEVLLENLSGGKGIKLKARGNSRKVAYISPMHFENSSYPYSGTMPVFIGVKSKEQNRTIPGAVIQIRRGTDYVVVASARVDELGENARITLPDGSQKTVAVAEDGTIRIDLPVNDLLYEMRDQRGLQIYFPGNEEYAPAVYMLSKQGAGGQMYFDITRVGIALQDEGIVPPVLGERPETALSVDEEAFYTAEIVWTPDTDTFRLHTPYSAGIRIVPKEGYSLNSETIGDTVSFGGKDFTYLSNSDGSIILPEVKRFDPLPGGEIRLLASPEEGGTVQGGGVYPADTQITAQAAPNEGWRFVKWTEDEITVSTSAEYVFTVLNDRTLTAVFEKIPRYTITVSASPTEGGRVTGGGSYPQGSAVTVHAAANEGYRFLRWEENGQAVSDKAEYAFTASANQTLTAIFEKEAVRTVSIAVSASPAEGGSATGGGSYPQNTAVTVRAAASEGYRFLRWEENGRAVSDRAEYPFTASADRELTAVFEKLPEPPAGEKESKTELGALSEVPEGLKNTPFHTVEKIIGELVRRLTVQPGYTKESFAAYDVQLLISLDGGKTWQPATEKDFPDEGITVTLPYPQGTGRQTHDFVVTHMFTLTSARLGTTAGETEQPPVEKTAEGIKVTFRGLSPVGIAWKAVEQEEPEKPAVTPTGSGKGGSSGEKPEDEYSFWRQVRRQIEAAKEGETLRINARDYQRMPLSVMKALRERPDVSLVIRHNGGRPITIPAGKALWEQKGSYYPLSYLEKYDFGGPAAEDAAYADKENPGTGAAEKIG